MRTYTPFLLSLLATNLLCSGAEEEGEEEEEGCYTGELAAWELRKWALTDPVPMETYDIKYFETELTLIREEEGPSWYLIGGGWQGLFYYETGAPGETRAGAYIYPDFRTAIVGLWLDNILLQGKSTLLGEACRAGGTWELKFEELTGPVLSYSPPSHFSLGVDPLQKDPYEGRTVEVLPSSIPGANYGLFATRDVIAGEVISFYSGYILHCDSSLRALDRRELSDEEEHVRNMYNIALDLTDGDNLCIDLPPDLGNDVNKYNATLGHKVNHSFAPSSEFVLFSAHPVLGTIMSLAAIQDIKQHEEITVNYGYNYTADPDQPKWFVQQWMDFHQNPHDEL